MNGVGIALGGIHGPLPTHHGQVADADQYGDSNEARIDCKPQQRKRSRSKKLVHFRTDLGLVDDKRLGAEGRTP